MKSQKVVIDTISEFIIQSMFGQYLKHIMNSSDTLIYDDNQNKKQENESNINETLKNNNIYLNEEKKDINCNMNDNNNEFFTDEDIRLGSKGPLITLIMLSAGPLLSQISNALYGVVNTFWVGKAIGDDGLSAISLYNNFDTIRRAFALFFQVAASAKFSNLFGKKEQNKDISEINNETDHQLFADLFRFAILIGCIASGITIPLTHPVARWFGAGENTERMGYKYIFPLLISTILPCIYLLCCGCIQAEGRAWTFCIIQVASSVLNMLIFTPLFLFGFKTGIAGVSYATICAELIPTLILLILFYRGKFTIYPQLKDLFKKPSQNFLSSISIGFSQLLYQLSLAFPGFLIRKYVGVGCQGDTKLWGIVMTGFSIAARIYILVISVTSAFSIGFIPAASYAYASALSAEASNSLNPNKRINMLRRFIKLSIYSIGISVCWCLFTLIFTIGIPSKISKLFSETPEVLEWSEFLVRTTEYPAPFVPFCIITASILQSMQYGKLATLYNCITQLIPLPIFSTIMFFTDKYNIGRLFYSYVMYDAFSFIVSLPFLLYFLIPIIREVRSTSFIWNNSGGIYKNEINDIEVPLAKKADVL